MTTQPIIFGVWSPSEATFWRAWITAGICTAPYEYAPNYVGMIETTTSWPGIVVKTPAVLDADGNVITPAENVPGWHANVKVSGALVEAFTAGLPAEGTIWERTRAAQTFNLTQQEADATTGFPASYRSPEGVTYADPSEFKHPRNVWA